MKKIDWTSLLDLPEDQTHCHILIVEDDEIARSHVQHVALSLDKSVEVDCTETAKDARELIDARPERFYSLVIADHFLKGEETGVDLWKYCHEKYPSLPFLMTSSLRVSSFLDYVEKSPGCPPIYLPKPFRSVEIRRAI